MGGTLAPGFTADGSVENFKRRRQTELKHGRIAMLATMGYITPEKLDVLLNACLRSLQMNDSRCMRVCRQCFCYRCDMSGTTADGAEDHRKIPRISQSVRWPEVRRCAEWARRDFQSSGCRLGSDSRLHGLLRGLPGSVSRNSRCCGRLWLQSADFQRSC